MSETAVNAAAPRDLRQTPFFQENLAAFREHAPHVYARLAQVRHPHSRLVVDDNGAIDIAFGDRRFYGEDAVAFTQRQLDTYLAKPERRYIDELTFDSKDGIEGRYKRALIDALNTEGATLATRRVDTASHFTIVFGLGLGLHIEPLVESTRCAELIIVEPNFDNLYNSLNVVDWRALFDRAAHAGCSVHLVLEKAQTTISSHLRRLVRLGDPALIDGVYIYRHYLSGVLKEAYLSFHREFALHVLGLGYFEDELLMMANAVGNLKRDDVRVLASPQPARCEPVIICGSGPSIDGDLKVIAAQRERAILVSMGSVLRTLLANGIRPDIHVETENHPTNAANIERVAGEFGLDGITLLGASTVQPVMTALFDESILYFRDRQSPAEVFGSGLEHMGSSGPTVANAALVTLLHLGFRDLYLFGVDMGSRRADHYHSADTYIGKGEASEWAGDARLPVPANFGGDAVAETILAWSRAGFENVLELHRDVRCVNCSDGARIAGATPMLPAMFDLPGPSLDRARIMADVRGNLPVFPLQLADQIWRESDLVSAARDIFARFDSILAAAGESDDPGLDWLGELYDLLNDASATSPVMGIFLFGSTCLFLGSFWWFDGRIAEAQIRARFRRAAVHELRQMYAAMECRLARLSADIGRCLGGELADINTDFDL